MSRTRAGVFGKLSDRWVKINLKAQRMRNVERPCDGDPWLCLSVKKRFATELI